MDKPTMRAFEKLEKREHLLRAARNQMALGRMSREAFREHEAQILERYRLSEQEQRAYDQHVAMTQGRKRRK